MSTSPHAEILTRFRERLGGGSALSNLASWIESNTRINDRPFSFKNHEFQIAIANDAASNLRVKKPTQVGLSELTVRICLALCAIRRNFKLIYILPSSDFASEFSKTRIDPVIEGSQRLTSMMVTAANSAKSKRIGSSFLWMAGAATKNQAISRPADGLVFDELDFQNPSISTSFMGRIAHSLDPWVSKFSTPTLPDYGIDLEMKLSDQRRYMVKCGHCNHRQAPSFKKSIRIPMSGTSIGSSNLWNADGFEADSPGFEAFTKAHLLDPDLMIRDAYMACEKCHKPLTASLLDPASREWVQQLTSVQAIHGYEVKPFDLPYYNTPEKLILRFSDYADSVDYWNFAQGECDQADDAQINLELQKTKFVLADSDATLNTPGMCMGADVGKRKVYVVIGFRTTDANPKTIVVFRKVLRIEDGSFIAQLKDLFNKFRCTKGVIDIGPDFTLSRAMNETYGDDFLMGSYVPDASADPLFFKVSTGQLSDNKDDEAVVKIQRTKGFNQLAREMNEGNWIHTVDPNMRDFVVQLGGMKRITQMQKTGDKVQTWVKMPNIEDHFLHACMYFKTALELVHDSSRSSRETPAPASVMGVLLGGAVAAKPNAGGIGTRISHIGAPAEQDRSVESLARRFGVF